MSSVNRSSIWKSSLTTVPAIGAVILPRVTCPCTLPAYAGLLGSLGLAFLLDATYLLPLTVGGLVVAVGSLGFRARQRHGYGPLAMGFVAAVLLVVGRFVLVLDAITYGGIGLLVVGSVWNSWPRRQVESGLVQIDVSRNPLTQGGE